MVHIHIAFSEFIEQLLHPDMMLIGAMASAGSSNDDVLERIVTVLDSFGKLVPLLKVAIVREVTTTQDHSTLFRENSTPTKLMSAFTRLLGRPYLERTIQGFVQNMLVYDPDMYEVDPTKTKRDVEANMTRLAGKCQEILDIILTSISVCPPPFRLAGKHLKV